MKIDEGGNIDSYYIIIGIPRDIGLAFDARYNNC